MDIRENTSNEKRLIDANAMRSDWLENCENEVVRCKDCKHYKPQKKSAHCESRCNRIITIKVQPYDFCSYGEKRRDKDGTT